MNQDTSPAINSTSAHNGMTLLQYYAGQALQGCLSDVNFNVNVDKAAEIAFSFAEAMLAEYNKRYGVDAEIGKTK